MSQITFSDIEYGNRKRKTKREEFLDIMEEIIPWEEWVEFVRPYYPAGKRGRPAKGIEKMLRMYLLQTWFNLSDEGVEDAIYDSYAFRKFMKIDFMNEQVPDATTLLKFRHMIEKNHLGEAFFKAINRVMEATGHIMHGGTIIDATIINAPSSTKNAEKKRDPEMHQTKKGNEWKFGMKCNIGVDAGSGLVHSITATSANVHDIKGIDDKNSKAAQALELVEKIFAEDKGLEGLPINEIYEQRLERIKPLLDRYWELLGNISANGGSNLCKAVNYSLNNRKELEAFLLDGRLELTNNRAERAVEPFVMGRKNWLFADTNKGADASMMWYSVIESAKLNNLNVYGYLLHLLTELPKLGEAPTDAQLDSLMPWAELPKYCE